VANCRYAHRPGMWRAGEGGAHGVAHATSRWEVAALHPPAAPTVACRPVQGLLIGLAPTGRYTAGRGQWEPGKGTRIFATTGAAATAWGRAVEAAHGISGSWAGGFSARFPAHHGPLLNPGLAWPYGFSLCGPRSTGDWAGGRGSPGLVLETAAGADIDQRECGGPVAASQGCCGQRLS